MRQPPNTKRRPHLLVRQIISVIIGLTLLLFLLLSACSSEPEVVEVTRVVTETIVTETEPVEVEVTRVVTETVIETVEIETEEEAVKEPPSATGSEDDSGPLPPEPNNEPKVVSRSGNSFANEIILETAVPLRANQSQPVEQPTAVSYISSSDPVELQKLCRLFAETFKKQCN